MDALRRAVEWTMRAAMWLALPLAALLFAQWPLRDLVQAHSREANDLAQVLFALYVAVAVTAASRDGAHLAMDVAARRYSARTRQWIARAASCFVAAPWAIFVIADSAGPFWRSLLQLERFADTLNPGYFIVRFAALLLAVLVLLQAVIDTFARER